MLENLDAVSVRAICDDKKESTDRRTPLYVII